MKVTKILQTLSIFALAIFANSGVASAHHRPDISRDDGIVTIEGTTGQDHCVVYYDGNEIEVVVWYYDEDDNRWRNVDRDYRISRVDRIVFHGFAGNDVMSNDTDIPLEAHGGSGDDTLIGGGGDDDLFGGDGWDYLNGYGGSDFLKPGERVEDEWATLGGEGTDTFRLPYYWGGSGFFFQRVTSDIDVTDFDPSEDVKQLFYSYPYNFNFNP